MSDIVERLRFDAARCEATFSKGVATNIEEAVAEIERLRAEPKLSGFLTYLRERYGDHPAHHAAEMYIDRLNADEHTQDLKEK